MARLIVDTSVLVDSERRGGSLPGSIGDADDVAVAAVTVAELRFGVKLAEGRRRKRRELFVAAILDAIPVEAYDLDVAEAHAGLLVDSRRAGRPRGPHDLIIAATAVARRRQVVTLDRRGFDGLSGVSVIDD